MFLYVCTYVKSTLGWCEVVRYSMLLLQQLNPQINTMMMTMLMFGGYVVSDNHVDFFC